jgi:hypothetical protein
LLADARDGRVQLPNTDFDIGQPPRWGDNPTADRAYVELIEKLAEKDFTATPPELRRAMSQFFVGMDGAHPDKTLRKKVPAVRALAIPWACSRSERHRRLNRDKPSVRHEIEFRAAQRNAHQLS